MRGEAEQLHDPAHGGQRQRLAELTADQFGNQRQGPQAEFEAVLQRRVVPNGLCQPSHFLGTDPGRTSGNRLGEQGVLSAIGKVGQPAKDAADIDAEGGRHALDGLPLANGLDRLLTHDLEGVVVDCPTIGVSFAFHRGIVSQYDNTFDRLSKPV